jgi:hypothetical protein
VSTLAKLLLIACVPALAAGCGSTRAPASTRALTSTSGAISGLFLRARPIGSGSRFHTPARGPAIGDCRARLGRRVGVHVELFAANRVVLVPAGIGTMAPRTIAAGRISRARCYGELVTLDPTGLVLVRSGTAPSLGDLFRSWGQPLSARRLGPFAAPAGTRVAVFVDGRRRRGSPASVPLSAHAEIVLEVGPAVPPHSSYAFPPGT